MKVLAVLILTGILVGFADGKHFLAKTLDGEEKMTKTDKVARVKSYGDVPR